MASPGGQISKSKTNAAARILRGRAGSGLWRWQSSLAPPNNVAHPELLSMTIDRITIVRYFFIPQIYNFQHEDYMKKASTLLPKLFNN